ncbi:hypothetical protein R6Q57_021123 [Mikania cordata]
MYRMQVDSSETQYMLKVSSFGHVLRAYVNGALAGSAHGVRKATDFTFENTIPLPTGINNISILSIMVGLPDSGAFMEHRSAGLHEVLIQELNFTNSPWGYQVGLLGEKLSIYTDEGSTRVSWSQYQNPSTLTWYKTTFDAPEGTEPVALNLGSMGKGEAWINGQSIGRYWVSFKTSSGSPSQAWYNVPRSFLKPTGNLLVLFEEEYVNPLNISIDTVSINKVCGRASDLHPPRVNSRDRHDRYRWRPKSIRVHLRCPRKQNISKIIFESLGNPSGDCENYYVGKCHSPNSQQVVEKKWCILITFAKHVEMGKKTKTGIKNRSYSNWWTHTVLGYQINRSWKRFHFYPAKTRTGIGQNRLKPKLEHVLDFVDWNRNQL